MQFNILIVDDSEIMRIMLKKVLSMTKVPLAMIHEAQNGLEALDILDRELVDVVLSDINMPLMDGEQMIRTMKGNVELQSLPVIVISTEGSNPRIESLKNLGVEEYLRKPFTPEVVRDALKKVLGDWE